MSYRAFLVGWSSNRNDSALLRNFIEYQVIPELERFAKWQRAINEHRFTVEYGFSPYILSGQHAQPFLKVLSGLNDEDRKAVSPPLGVAIGEMRGATDNQ